MIRIGGQFIDIDAGWPGRGHDEWDFANISYIQKTFFVRQSSEYETSDSDRKVIQLALSVAISPVTIVYFKIPSEKMKSFCLHKTGF